MKATKVGSFTHYEIDLTVADISLKKTTKKSNIF